MVNKQLDEIRIKSLPVLQKYGVRKAAVFGSTVRGEERQDSDVDMIVDFGDQLVTITTISGMQSDLSHVLGKQVDLSQYKTLHKLYKPFIFKEQVIIYNAEN